MPYLNLVTTSTYPYSIYPDLQDTQFVIANSSPDTVAAAMNFAFFLTQEMQDFPSYLSVAQLDAEIDASKHHVFFGSIHDKLIQEQSENAPISFKGVYMHKPYPFVKRFVEYKNILDDDRLQKHRFVNKMLETNQIDTAIVAEMFRSEYDGDKTELIFAAESGKCLNGALQSLLKYENRHLLQGDTLLYDPVDEDGIAFNIKKKYILTSMDWLDKISLIVSANPVRYIIVTIILLLLATWLLRRLLRAFKERKHKDVD